MMICTNRRAVALIAIWCCTAHLLVAGLLFGVHSYLNAPRQNQNTVYECILLDHGSVNTMRVSPLFIKLKTFYRIYWTVHYRVDNTTVSNATLVTPWVETKLDLEPYLHLPIHTIVDCWGPPQDYELISASPKNWPDPLRGAQAETETFLTVIASMTIVAFGAALIYGLAQINIARNAARSEYIHLNMA